MCQADPLGSISRLCAACENDCSFHGVCIGTECECDIGWSGTDCSYPVMAFVSFGITGIHPPSGLALGGTEVMLHGYNFAQTPRLSCRFEPVNENSSAPLPPPTIVPALYHNSSLLSCQAPPCALAPPWSPHTEPGASVSPPANSSAPVLRAALSTPDATYVVEVAEEPPAFSNNGLRFFQWDAAIYSARPAGGPLEGNTTITLRGRGLRRLPTGEAAQCRFGSRQVPASLLEGGRAARCVSPSADAAGAVALSLSLNSANASVSNDWTQPIQFTYYNLRVRSVSPSRGHALHPRFVLEVAGLEHAVSAARRTAYGTPMTALNLTAHEATYGAAWLAIQQQQQQEQQQAQPGLSRTPVAAGAAGLLPLLHALDNWPSPLAAAVLPVTLLPHMTTTVEAAIGARATSAGGSVVMGALLLLAGSDCTIAAFRVGAVSGAVSTSAVLGASMPRAEPLPGHSAVAVGVALKAAGETRCVPTLGDLDGDGRADLLVGVSSGEVLAFRNLANVSAHESTGAQYGALFAAVFVRWEEQPLGSTMLMPNPAAALTGGRANGTRGFAYGHARPYLIDADLDGDLDLFVSCGACNPSEASPLYFRNVRSTILPSWRTLVPVLDGDHALAEVASHVSLAPNATVALTFGEPDGSGRPTGVFAGIVVHWSDSGAHVIEGIGAHPSYRVPRRPTDLFPSNSLAEMSFALDETALIVDLDGDGDNDLLAISPNGRRRVFVSAATEERARMLKCKFGGSFETRPCWSCPNMEPDPTGDPLPPPHQVPAMELAADSVSCVPPRLDGFPGRPRAYAGPYRLELTANDQQWTQRALTYEYLSPWDVLSLYPSSGPSLGGTFIQVRGMGLYAAATGEVHPVAWYGAFITHDVDANAQLEPQELEGAIAHVRAAGALPEATLVDEAAVRLFVATHDLNLDGRLSFDEFQAARPGGGNASAVSGAVSSGTPTLPEGWSPACLFGRATRSGIAGWTADGLALIAPHDPLGEWLGCYTPSATETDADATATWHFTTEGQGEPTEPNFRVLAVSRLHPTRGGITPPYEDVTRGWNSVVEYGYIELTRKEPYTGATALFELPQPQWPAPVSPYFVATFRFLLGGGSGGDGISFSYGEVPDGCVDELGA